MFAASSIVLIFIYFLFFVLSMISFGFLVRSVTIDCFCLSAAKLILSPIQCLVQLLSNWSDRWFCCLVCQLSPLSIPPAKIPGPATVSECVV